MGKKKVEILLMKNGDRHQIESADGKYYRCKDGKVFRLMNPEILKIEFESQQEKEVKEYADQ